MRWLDTQSLQSGQGHFLFYLSFNSNSFSVFEKSSCLISGIWVLIWPKQLRSQLPSKIRTIMISWSLCRFRAKHAPIGLLSKQFSTSAGRTGSISTWQATKHCTCRSMWKCLWLINCPRKTFSILDQKWAMGDVFCQILSCTLHHQTCTLSTVNFANSCRCYLLAINTCKISYLSLPGNNTMLKVT